ncbi:sugar MFS transporter [Sphingopyxis sp. KK2]|uniref:sugar MFS transporter n=1 Tax=Sphingopyxis sp. KK2 TaxID=1855727 RepID=UPI00097E6DD3|nr:sugar MFS transporter [Sphingopyxis sp. KK2]
MALAPNVATSAGPDAGGTDGRSRGSTLVVLVLAFAVFFLLGGVTNINDLLVGKFKSMFHLTHAQANLVQMAFFIAYGAFSIPAGIIMSKLGYIRTFVLGFVIIAAAAFLFVPASAAASYPGFLAALFCIGAGITVLQVAMNPVITTLGPARTSHSRLTFAQAFNSVGVFLMVYGGATFLLGDGKPLDPETSTDVQIQAYRVAEGASIGTAYMWLGILMLVIAAIFWFNRSALDHAKADAMKLEGTWDLLTHNRRVQLGALCIFVYVGAEVAIGSNLIAYLGDQSVMGLGLQAAGKLVAIYWLGALIGRILGGFILRTSVVKMPFVILSGIAVGAAVINLINQQNFGALAMLAGLCAIIYGLFFAIHRLEQLLQLDKQEAVAPGKILSAFALGAIGLVVLSAVTTGALSGWALILVGFCNSLMFPTIFSLGTEGLGDRTPQASGILCTAIIGGAIVPFLFGLVADIDLRLALAVPLVCYAIIAGFGLWAARQQAAASA